MPKGGSRPNAGRKKKFDGETMRLYHVIPVAWLPEFEKWLKRMMRKEKMKESE